jgi:hypothetical protein
MINRWLLGHPRRESVGLTIALAVAFLYEGQVQGHTPAPTSSTIAG